MDKLYYILILIYILLLVGIIYFKKYRSKDEVETFSTRENPKKKNFNLNELYKKFIEDSHLIKDNRFKIDNITNILDNNVSSIINMSTGNINMINNSRMESFLNNGYTLLENQNETFDKKGIKEHLLSYLKKNNVDQKNNDDDDDDDDSDNDITNTNIKIIRFIVLEGIDQPVCDVNPLKTDDFSRYKNLTKMEKSSIALNNAIVNAFGILIDENSDYYKNNVILNVYEKIKKLNEKTIINKIKEFVKKFLEIKNEKKIKKTNLRNIDGLVEEWLKRFPCDQIYDTQELIYVIKLHLGSFVDLVSDFSDL